MKSKSYLINCLTIGLLDLLVGVIAFRIGGATIGEYNPPWARSKIESVPQNAAKIAYLDIVSTLEDPAGDIIYLQDKNGKLFSNTILKSEWVAVESIPNSSNDYLSECTNNKLGPTNSHMWDTPPIEKEVVDSAGAIFERPVSIIVRCYILFEDGSLEVWTHSGNAMDSMGSLFVKLICGIVGSVIGIVIGIIYINFRKYVNNKTN